MWQKLAIKGVVISAITLLSGCITTTALYGNKFVPVGDSVYTLQVAYGGNELRTSSIELATRNSVIQASEEFLAERSDYSSYSIIKFKRVLVPSYMLYTVKFNQAE